MSKEEVGNRDLVGRKFGRLSPTHKLEIRPITWQCVCDCGQLVNAMKDHLIAGLKKSCGCLRSEVSGSNGSKRALDLLNQKHGRLTVIERAGKVRTEVQWSVMCDCGTLDVATSNQLVHGKKTQCRECSRLSKIARTTKHGHTTWKGTKPLTYAVWAAMRDRCNNKNNKGYQNYGARGIKVCPEWDDYSVFLSDMGDPGPGELSIDRVNNDGNYCKENCKWTDRVTQANNRRNNSTYEYEGKVYTLKQLSDLTGVPYRSLQYRLKKGSTVYEAVPENRNPKDK